MGIFWWECPSNVYHSRRWYCSTRSIHVLTIDWTTVNATFTCFSLSCPIDIFTHSLNHSFIRLPIYAVSFPYLKWNAKRTLCYIYTVADTGGHGAKPPSPMAYIRLGMRRKDGEVLRCVLGVSISTQEKDGLDRRAIKKEWVKVSTSIVQWSLLLWLNTLCIVHVQERWTECVFLVYGCIYGIDERPLHAATER